MSFAKELQAKADAKAIELATSVAPNYKQKLLSYAEQGYKNCTFSINKNDENLPLIANELFISKLKQELDGVEVKYQKNFLESPFFKGTGIGEWKHYLIFEW